MKRKFTKYIALMAVGMLSFHACQTDFEKINRDFRHPTEDDLKKDGLDVGGFFTSLQTTIFPVGNSGTAYVNDYQIPYTLAGACWIGYISPAQNKWIGRGFPSYSLKGWSDYTFSVMYKKTFASWLNLKEQTIGDDAVNALLDIIKVTSLHKATDTFGPIPYLKISKENMLQATYDSQKDVYSEMLKELDNAVQVLDQVRHNVLPKYDLMYGGDYVKWGKLANSMMLRLAMRVVYADEALAKEYAEKAISNPFGVMVEANDMAQLSQGAGLFLNNPLVIINGSSYNDARMGAEIYSYMVGYEDPRTDVYFTKAKQSSVEGFYPVFKSLEKVSEYLDRTKYSLLNVQNATPIYIMKASEVAFLRAEGALRNWNMGGATAEELYNKAIALSFKENGIDDSKAKSYVANSSNKPVKFVDNANPANNLAPVSTITVKWEGKEFEKSLEQIITQKYIALYPDGQEAWSEYRRTGYPHIFPAKFVRTDSDVDGTVGPTRIVYSNKEYTDNLENINKAVQMLGGPDKGNTRVWWDKKSNK